MKYVLGPYHGSGTLMDPFAAPPNAIEALDLRAMPDMGTPGVALFGFPDAAVVTNDYRVFGVGDLRSITPQEQDRAVFSSALGFVGQNRVLGDTLIDWLESALTVLADPIGDDRAKPLMPGTRNKRIRLVMNGNEYLSRALDLQQQPAILDAIRRNYRLIRQDVIAGNLEPDRHLKYLGGLGDKYGIKDPDLLFIPNDLPNEKPLRPETTHSDDFNTADSGTLGNQLTWSDVVGGWSNTSNEARSITTGTSSTKSTRAEHDLSSDDHYAQAELIGTTIGGVVAGLGVATRFNSAAETYYYTDQRIDNNTIRMRKNVSGSNTVIGSDAANTDALPDTLRMDVDGSALTADYNAVELRSETDVTITGNVRCGLTAFQSSGQGQLDDFICADLAAGGSSVPVFYHHRVQMGS